MCCVWGQGQGIIFITEMMSQNDTFTSKGRSGFLLIIGHICSLGNKIIILYIRTCLIAL